MLAVDLLITKIISFSSNDHADGGTRPSEIIKHMEGYLKGKNNLGWAQAEEGVDIETFLI